MSEMEQQEFSLEDILKEFGDENEEIPEKSPEEILHQVEEEVLREQGGAPKEELPQETEVPETQLETGELAPEAVKPAVAEGSTIRFEKISDVKGAVRNAQRIDNEEEEREAPAAQQETTEPFSEEWEPEYEQPMGIYEPPNPIPFQPRSRLRELKKKLVEGPERMYYALLEKGLGKLQLAILASVIVVLISAVATLMHACGLVPENRLRLMVFWQFLAMLIAALLGSQQLIDGFCDMLHKRFSLNSMLVFTFVLCCVDGGLCLYQQRVPCCAAFSLQVAMSLWNAYENRNTQMGQLDTMRKATQLDSITAVEDYHEGEKGLLRGEGQVEDFMESVDSPCGLEKAICVYALVALILSVVAGVVASVLHGVTTGIQVAAVTSLAAVPASMFVTVSRPMAVLEHRLHKLGAVLCGWQGVEGLSGKVVFPVDHNDLFPGGTIKMNGVKFYGSRQPDEIVAYAAALIDADGGSLAPLFNHLLDSRNGRHYPVEKYNPYGGGGIGGEVCGDAVLAGNIEFLKSMGVEVPEGIRVDRAVCVAVDGELCGLFAIAYERDKACAAGINTLCSYRGLKTAVISDDFVITDEFVREHFDVKTKQMIFPEFDVRSQLREKEVEPGTRAQALVTETGLAPFAYAVTGARVVKRASVTGMIVHMIGGGLGIAMMVLLGILGATELLTPDKMFLYELIWMIPGLLITEWTRSI